MKHRKLRIAWSVWWGLFSIFLCGLWIQSYGTSSRINNISLYDANNLGKLQLGSHHGGFAVLVDYPLIELFDVSQIFFKSNEVDDNDSTRQFSYQHTKSSLFFVLPFRLPIVLILLFGALPWISWSRQFGLRTTVIVTTIVAVVLGVIFAPANFK